MDFLLPGFLAEVATPANFGRMIGVDDATGLSRGEFPTESSCLVSTVFMGDLFSFPLAGDEGRTLRLLLTEEAEVDDADDEEEEEEFLLRRLATSFLSSQWFLSPPSTSGGLTVSTSSIVRSDSM